PADTDRDLDRLHDFGQALAHRPPYSRAMCVADAPGGAKPALDAAPRDPLELPVSHPYHLQQDRPRAQGASPGVRGQGPAQAVELLLQLSVPVWRVAAFDDDADRARAAHRTRLAELQS